MKDRFIGTLLGLAVGDALGAPVEFLPAEEIVRLHGTLNEMNGGGHFNWRPGEYTDDTSMMLCIAESLAENGGYVPEDIARRFLDWYKTNPKDIGGTTRKALARLDAGISLFESGIAEGKANGSVMRCAPLSLICHDEEFLIKTSIEVSCITHSHPEAALSCVFINVMIAQLLLGADKEAAATYATRKVWEISPDFADKYLIGSSYKPNPSKGLAVNTMLLATGSFLPARSFEEAVVRAVNLGGDADTTGAVTGALAGAYYGRQGIPRRWSTKLNPKPARHFVKLGEILFTMDLDSR